MFIPKLKNSFQTMDSKSSNGSYQLSPILELKSKTTLSSQQNPLEERDEYGIVQDLLSEIKDNDNFRHIEKVAFNSRYNISEDPVLFREKILVNDSDRKPIETQQAYLKFQTSYIEK